MFNTTQKNLRRAIDLAGGQSALARAINCSGQLILSTITEPLHLTSDSFGAKPAF